MKAFDPSISTIVFLVPGYVLFTDVQLSAGFNEYIYMSLLLVLMLICVVGIAINVPLIMEEKRKMKVLMSKKINKALNAGTPEFTF